MGVIYLDLDVVDKKYMINFLFKNQNEIFTVLPFSYFDIDSVGTSASHLLIKYITVTSQ